MKRANPLARILFSLALLAVVVYMYQQRKTSGAASQPFPADSPSAVGPDRFSWIPKYPGANTSEIHSRVAHGELNYGYEYKSGDPMRQVVSFYESRLRATGFTVQTRQKGDIEVDLHAESPDRKRMLDVVVETIIEKTGEKTAPGKTAEQPAAASAVTVAAIQK